MGDVIKDYAPFLKKINGWNKNKFRTMKIVFRLSSPISTTYPWIFFDAVITHLMFQKAFGREIFITDKSINLSQYMPKGGKPFSAMYDKASKLAVPEVSVSVFRDNAEYKTETIYKRFEERFASFNGKIRIGSGKFKSYAMKHIYVLADSVTFYLRGDRDFIETLIKENLFALGSETRIGYGAIKDFDIEYTDKNFAIVSNGVAMRPIPIEFCEEYEDVAMIAYRAPYWSRKNVRMCVVPFTPCKLKAQWRKYYG